MSILFIIKWSLIIIALVWVGKKAYKCAKSVIPKIREIFKKGF